ncbi:rhomboid-related protein 2-like isoform X1 [Haliotis rubra]|uniref:rhomboid-related protein 2-like isoform X1 n=1 Tax=Haliotis rubra TaxID=36100 RepID=UPI001EE6211F|nr:rhomboid-related protein 2-like isoform X1 [Haliotis rubra]XP_046547281.1 rhomboid-related protein 2-like isoform X1 [Haliotis rubra]XP_046547292.1 rhomboid-related protein 2-like isoform X1 [Haliotis rubra]XP_046547299.1 rhomboid-related protein 2-like isoform X1 [Haliotis rubra]XP_046547306.1 rhomboid-related protein 2-like isoform X1 [Haliotis rubra]XP_046547313.1 rhomboid-related protein 2-like isoform X1 [Haliotis rubra]XP_046547318.1 rhomboid-related protein 2-like isoform X1 [Haliot
MAAARGGRSRGNRVDDLEMRQLRSDLDRNFKPIFDRHGPEGVALGELQREMQEEGITDKISKRRLNQLLDRADHNDDNMITYTEFVNLMTSDEGLTKSERSAFRSFLGAAIANIVPQSLRNDFLANYNCRPPPLFIIIMSTAEIVIFGVYAAELAKQGTPVTATSGVPMYSPLVYTPRRRYEAWRYLTYMFIHQGFLHILSNMIFQLLFGLPLEIVHKWWRVMVVYLCGVIAGSLAHSVTDHSVALVGASGGVYALLGAHLAAVATNWKEMNYKCCEGNIARVLLSAPVRLFIILTLVVPDTSLAIYRRVTAPEDQKVGVSAHIGGFLTGLLLGIPS